jgi:hypothetical protein
MKARLGRLEALSTGSIIGPAIILLERRDQVMYQASGRVRWRSSQSRQAV